MPSLSSWSKNWCYIFLFFHKKLGLAGSIRIIFKRKFQCFTTKNFLICFLFLAWKCIWKCTRAFWNENIGKLLWIFDCTMWKRCTIKDLLAAYCFARRHKCFCDTLVEIHNLDAALISNTVTSE